MEKTQEEKNAEWESHSVDIKLNLDLYLKSQGLKFEDLNVFKFKKSQKYMISFGLVEAVCSEPVSADMDEGTVKVCELCIEHRIPLQGDPFWHVIKSGAEKVNREDVLEE